MPYLSDILINFSLKGSPANLQHNSQVNVPKIGISVPSLARSLAPHYIMIHATAGRIVAIGSVFMNSLNHLGRRCFDLAVEPTLSSENEAFIDLKKTYMWNNCLSQICRTYRD